MQLLVNAPLNSLSFGNVSYNMLKALYRANVEVGIFPIHNQVDVSAFDKIDGQFGQWLQESLNNGFSFLKKDIPTFKMWHIQGSETRFTPNQFLYTFYELDSPTEVEQSIVKLQNHTFFSSNYSKNHFEDCGADNVSFCPIGFDEDFHVIDKEFMPDKIHFGIMGKFEKRKATREIIQLWIEKYGNNPKYQLTAAIINPFLKPEDMERVVKGILKGQNVFNVNFIPYMKTNSEVNNYLNAIDVDLSGLSKAEGWGLPSFNSTALGKWSIVLNAHAHKDWATKENSILVSPNGKESAEDGMFFKQGTPFNCGNIYTWNRDEVSAAMDKAVSLAKTKNAEGLKLQQKFTYDKTIAQILAQIKSES